MPRYIIIGLVVIVGTFLIMNYWPKLKNQTKTRILMGIFGIFFISIFVLLFLLMYQETLIDIFSIIIAGIFSCIILDILGFLMKFLGIPEPSWSIVGRWTYYMLKKAKFYNPNIAEMASFKYEVVLGWLFHYYLSICWAIIYYICFILIGLKMSYFSGFIFGALTTLAPLLIFLPFTGQGIFARNTNIPLKTSLIFLIRHSIYGIAMYEGCRWYN